MRLVPVKLASVPFYDSIGHATLYGILAFLLNLALNGRLVQFHRSQVRIPLAGLLVIALGALDELLQTMSPFRTADPYDFAADAVGAIIFSLFSFRFLATDMNLR
jgi:VanZ family protein